MQSAITGERALVAGEEGKGFNLSPTTSHMLGFKRVVEERGFFCE